MRVTAIQSPGDVYGFAALIVIALASFFMLMRPALLKLTRNIMAIRVVHISLSTLAGVLLIVHVAYLFSPPVTTGIDLGYASIGIALMVWISGTAFLERLRDSLFFHGTLASLLVALALAHAATASTALPFDLSQAMLGGTAAILLANAAYQLQKGMIGR